MAVSLHQAGKIAKAENGAETVIPAKAGIQRRYSKCGWILSRKAGLVGLTGFRPDRRSACPEFIEGPE